MTEVNNSEHSKLNLEATAHEQSQVNQVGQITAHTVNFGTPQRAGKPSQAPLPPNHYVDRPECSLGLKERLLTKSEDMRPLVMTAIHGLGSVGKSTLASALAHDSDVEAHFCDGILWATLGQQPDVLSLLGGWVQALGDYNFKPLSIESTTNHLRTLLHDKAVLLVVDDAWNTKDAQAFKINGSRCQVIVTTRDAAIAEAIGASIYYLDVMNLSQAMELLTKKLGRDMTGAECQEAETLAKEVGYLPLALELAAAQVASGISWAVLLQDIQREIARLKTFDRPGSRDADDECSLKRLSLIASLNLSVQRLEEEERQCFAWLGVLPEDATITHSMTVTLWDLDDERDATETLQYLQSKALLSPSVPLLDGTPTYRLHDLFHDLACNLLTAPTIPKRRGDLPGLGLTLVDAHGRLLERYCQKTKNGFWHTLPGDGYIHQRLSWHLEKAGKTEGIHALLNEETESGRNGWYEACDHLGQTASFVTDVARAWRLAEEMFEENPQQSIALQCRYALIVTSLNSLAKNIPGHLMAALVKQELWSPAQGLAYAQQVRESTQRAEALSAMAPHLSDSLLSLALGTTLGIQDDYDRAYALSGLAPHLPPELLQQALDTALGIQSGDDRADALKELAPHLPPELLQQTLDTARSIQDDSQRACTLSGLAPHLPPELLQQTLDTARSIQDDFYRAYALSRLAPHLPEILEEALDTAHKVKNGDQLVAVLDKLAPHLPPELLQKAFNDALSIQHDYYRSAALNGLAPYLLPELLQQALDAAFGIQMDWCFSVALNGLAPHLPPELLQQAFEFTRSIENNHCRGHALKELAPHLPPELLQQALEAARSIQDGSNRASALAGLAPHLPELLQEALDAAYSIQDDSQRAYALSRLAPHQPEIRQEALETVRSIQDDSQRAYALSRLAPHQPEIRQEALETACSALNDRYSGSAISELAPHLPLELLQQAFDNALSMKEDWSRGEVLGKLAPYLPLELLQQAFDNALSVKKDGFRCNALSKLAPHLPPELLQQALDAARSIQDDYDRADALAGLVPYLPRTQQAGILQEALEIARSNKDSPDEYKHPIVLAKLAPHLPEILQEAFETACSAINGLCSGSAIIELAPHLPPELLQQAFNAACSMKNESQRAERFSSLLPVLNLASIEFDFWREILHNLSHHERSALLEDIPKLSDAIIALGGTEALVATVRAIQEVCRQWP